MKKALSYIILFVVLFSFALAAKESVSDLKKKQVYNSVGKKNVGHITIKLNFGLYDFTSKYENNSSNETRNYSVPFAYPMAGFEIALRFGKDTDKLYFPDQDAGFGYYRSNKGFFIDMELGGKFFCGPDAVSTQWDCRPPQLYSYESIKNGVSSGKKNVNLTDTKLFHPLTAATIVDNAAANDGIDSNVRDSSGTAGAVASSFYFNNFFHMTPLNYILNFGRAFKWIDISLGPSLQIARYVDYGDPVRLQSTKNDSTITNIHVGLRTFIHIPFTSDRVRISSRIYYPLYSQLARFLKDDGVNNEEYIFDTSLDIYIVKYLFLYTGYEFRYWRINQSSSDSVNSFRPGFEYVNRKSYHFYVGMGINFGMKP